MTPATSRASKSIRRQERLPGPAAWTWPPSLSTTRHAGTGSTQPRRLARTAGQVRAIHGRPSKEKNPRTGVDSKVGRTGYYANRGEAYFEAAVITLGRG